MIQKTTKPGVEAPDELTNTVPVKYPRFLRQEIADACAKTGMKDQEIVRLATWIGLAALAKIEFDLGAVLLKAGLPNWEHMRELRTIAGHGGAEHHAESVALPSKTQDEKRRKKA